MPIYAYRCAACGHSRDVLQKMSDPVLSVCPVCGADQFQKQVTAAGFQLKGSGWYATDFKGNGANAPAPAATPAGGEGGGATTPAAAPAPAPAADSGSSGGSGSGASGGSGGTSGSASSAAAPGGGG
jgi:putative FmdB family regulatory protein